MKHYIRDNKYFIENEKGEVVFTLALIDEKLDDKDQVVIETKTEVFAGPVEFLSFGNCINK